MRTRVMPEGCDALLEAARLLSAGELVIFPTETVYGIGANGMDTQAVRGIYAAKGRPADNPLILHVGAQAELSSIVREVPDTAWELIRLFWPGPLTIVLSAAAQVPEAVRAGLPTVAVRCPESPWTRAMITRCGFAVAAPSANLSGRPSPTTAQDALLDMQGRVQLIVDGGPCRVGVESTVITLCMAVPTVLRPGGITLQQLREAIGAVEVHPSVLAGMNAAQPSPSPGMKYRHYAPRASMVMVEDTRDARKLCRLYDQAQQSGNIAAIVAPQQTIAQLGGRRAYSLGDDSAQAAYRLFAILRQLDQDGVQTCYVQTIQTGGMGLAVMNRLLHATGFIFAVDEPSIKDGE